VIHLVFQRWLLQILETFHEDQRPIHRAHIILGDDGMQPFLIEDDFRIIIGHSPGGPNDGRPKLVENHLSKARFLLLDLFGMSDSGDALSNLFKLHLDNLLLQVLSLPCDLGVQDLHRVGLSMEVNLAFDMVEVLRCLLCGLFVHGLQTGNLLVNRHHFLALERLHPLPRVLFALDVIKYEAEAALLVLRQEAEIIVWLLRDRLDIIA
jgi:hypothetical protein